MIATIVTGTPERHLLEVGALPGSYRCSCGRWRYTHPAFADRDGVVRRSHERHCEEPDEG
jgi:hypothetical protein